MGEGNYERIVERIAKSAAIGKEEVEKRVDKEVKQVVRCNYIYFPNSA